MARRVVVTGVGAVTPLGRTVGETWASVLASRSAVAPITRFAPEGFPVRFAAQAEDPPDPGPWLDARGHAALEPETRTRKGRLTVAALREAIEQARFDRTGPRVAVCLGSEAARPELAELATRMHAGSLPGSRS